MPQPLTDDGKIKLKELVSHPTKRFKHLNQYLQAEVVETVEQVIETTVEEQTQIQQQETQNYKGKMVDLREFSKAYWPLVVEKVNNSQQAHSKGGALFKLLSEELFANLPQAIKFLSPDAAEQLAKNLPNFVTLNKDNLPQGFFLAKTDEGEWVMDYDPYLERDDTNPYTLKASPVDESEETQRNCQARIAQYSTAQASLLQKFLGETNPSQYDLRNTLDAFDFFWAEFSYLCQKEDLDPEAVQHDWERPEHGNPLVYMERLITILRNARSVREQVQSWSVIHDRHKNTHSFSLSNYGPYYASMYEGFSLVATLMELEIPHLIQKSQPFNPHFKLYRTALDKIANVLTYDEDIYQAQEMRPHQYWLIKPDNWYDSVISLCYRFLGQEEQGISLQSFCDIAQAYKDQKYGKGSWYHGNSALLAALLFLTHKPVGDPRQALFQFFDVMENADNDSKALMTVIRRLTGLYNRDIRLDISQGTVLFRILRGMNSAEFQGYGISKAALLDRLFDQLEQNRLAVLNLFDVLETRGYFKFPLSFALDTAEVLREDPEVASFFQDDLLSFSYLLTDPKAEGTRQDPRIKEIRNLLRKAVVNQEQPNNLLYALQKIMKSATFFSYRDFLGFCNELDSLGDFNPGKVDSMLASSDLKIKPRRSSAFQVKNTDIRSSVIELIKLLAKTRGEDMGLLEGELATKSTEALQELLNIKWEQNLGLMGHGFKTAFDRIVRKIRDAAIAAAFAPHTPGSKDLLALFAEKIANTPDFQNARDLSNVQDMCHKIQSLSDLVKKIRSNPYVQAEESTFITIFSKPEYSSLSYQSLFSLLGLLIEMPSRDYSGLLQALLMPPNQPESRLIECLTQLNHWSFPTAYMESFIPFARQNLTKADFQDYLQLLHDRFVKDPDDPMLEVLMTNSQLDFDDCKAILKISEQMPENQDKLAKLLSNLVKNNQLKGFISVIKAIGDLDKESLIIEIVSLAQASSGKQLRAQETRISPDLIHALKGLSPEQLRQVRTFYSSNLLSQRCLYQGLKNRDKEQNFGEFLASFEKVPFGQRDPAQFDCSAVERVVNNSRDLLNQSLQSYHYRKQLAESFLFVNAIGHSVPIFANKTAKDLSNAEIAQYFSMLKQTKKETPRDAFQARLVVLALLREAMYRSTGEFPYSTQMLSLIEGMMQPGDYISNIDTGQGKSLVDCMRAALLYLDSDRVELTTSSIVDAKRDIGNYGPFLKLLGIPYSEKPVIASSKLIDFKQEGINFTTMTQIDLFFAKAKALGETYEKPSTKVSLVVNESDHAILDDKVIHRFATADNQTPGFGQEWVYEGIYEFTADRNFIRNKNTTAKQDIANLKLFLKAKALHSKKSAKLVDKFSDKQYREWIESGLIVNYIIKENEEYVIPKEFETKKINGKSVQTKVVKVLLSDKKVSPDSTFGNGIQQILYAKLNKQEGKQEFVIEPQSKTIISSTNRNLLQYYRSKKGFIWGSSGTVGSREEVLEQFKKYRLGFGKHEPHQKNSTTYHTPVVLASEDALFDEVVKQLTNRKRNHESPADVVYCKDIETAKKLYQKLRDKGLDLQLYTGLGKEEEVIRKAAEPGMITITTPALGRNTDFPYDKKRGLNVWHTYLAGSRLTDQQSGRTGRQGSKGDVRFYFTKQELQGSSIAEIRTAIDAETAKERLYNEELYDIIGYFLAQVEGIPSESFIEPKTTFLAKKWSEFSKDCESIYRSQHHNSEYSLESFLHERSEAFLKMMQASVKAEVFAAPDLVSIKKELSKDYEQPLQYEVYEEPVKLSDCTTPLTMAYNMLGFSPVRDKSVTATAIKGELKTLFEQLEKGGNARELNEKYLRYLFANPAELTTVVRAHKEFLSQFLKEQARDLSLYNRWFGFSGKLNQLADNAAYLALFQSFASIPREKEEDEIVEFEAIQQAMQGLLSEYLATGWFVNARRVEKVAEIQEALGQASNLDELMEVLFGFQVQVAKEDNASGFFRKLKPLHFFGDSRLQTSLSRALKLGAALSREVHTHGAERELADLAKADRSSLSLDKAKKINASERFGQKKVIAKSLEEISNLKYRDTIEGMTGREDNKPRK